MSFVRVGRPRQLPKSKRPVCTKKAVAPKREWVSRRHEIHKSHNKAAAQWELREKALRCRLRCAGSPAPLDQASLNIIREVFSDQLLLQDVLARSDKAMAVVKDLFGDAPRRQTGHPSVTMAPNCDSDSELPVLQRPDPPTQLSLLSQSMMDKQVCLCKERFHVYIYISGMRVILTNSCLLVSALNATVAVQRIQSKQNQSEEAKEEHSALVSQVLTPDVSLNQIHSCTNRTRNCVSQGSQLDGSSVASLSGNQSSLGQLQALLGQVEADLDTLSPDTAPGSAQSPEQHRTQGLTGFSVALVSTLGRLVHVLKQREEEAQKRAQEKRQLEEELREHRGLIDALTTETMILREEAATLQAVLQQQIAELEQKLDTVVLALGGFGLLEGHTDTPQDSDVEAAGPYSLCLSVCTWVFSTSSLTSLALTRLPSTSSLSLSSDPLSSQNPPEAILAEIAQLSRQNDSIRAQLSQVKVLGSGVTSPNTLNVSILEQHLLELNRQNAAARVKLLELIEQQKQSVMSKVPPSASPISQSASCLLPVLEKFVMEKHRYMRTNCRLLHGCARVSPPYHLNTKHFLFPQQMEKQREQEGWFALSAHMRSKKSNN
uniref:Spindle and centriole-associated protein 1 n=1 Tax=Monopterus albus TaxID=43700 RepID=A0A3Q3KNW3_MONAL